MMKQTHESIHRAAVPARTSSRQTLISHVRFKNHVRIKSENLKREGSRLPICQSSRGETGGKCELPISLISKGSSH